MGLQKHTVIYYSYKNKLILVNVKNLCKTLLGRKICHTHKSPEAGTRSWSNLQRVIEFNQEAWLEAYEDMNKELRTNAKINFEKDFFKLMSILFSKRKHGNIELVRRDKRGNYLVPVSKYHTAKCFLENLLTKE